MIARPRWTRALPIVAAALVFAATRPASAYVRYLTDENGNPFSWFQSCVQMTAYTPGPVAAMTTAQIEQALTQSAAAWSSTRLTCSFLSVTVEMSTASPPPAKYDGRNSIIFRTDNWCKTTAPDDCYEDAALAITSVFVKSSGQIVDGDIEVNAVNFVWADLELAPQDNGQDLQNAVTHEIGHLIGLDHTCYTYASDRVRPFDNLGSPVPDCATAPEAVRETTMFASAVPGDVSKRTLSPDEDQAVCDIYPLASDPRSCPAPGIADDGGCACATGDPVGASASRVAGLVATLLFALTWVARRRSRRRSG